MLGQQARTEAEAWRPGAGVQRCRFSEVWPQPLSSSALLEIFSPRPIVSPSLGPGSTEVYPSLELVELRWASLGEALELLPSVFSPVHDYLAGRRRPQ
jgi:hypothetical protein